MDGDKSMLALTFPGLIAKETEQELRGRQPRLCRHPTTSPLALWTLDGRLAGCLRERGSAPRGRPDRYPSPAVGATPTAFKDGSALSTAFSSLRSVTGGDHASTVTGNVVLPPITVGGATGGFAGGVNRGVTSGVTSRESSGGRGTG